jgi:hypothetical protein
VVVLMHAPLHADVPVGHVHVPLLQEDPGAQTWPHMPQFDVLVLMSTHDVPQSVSVPQPIWHVPARHAAPPVQA